MKSLKILILFAVISAVQCGGPSSCEPFVSNFQAFYQALTNALDQFRSYAFDISTAYPVFAPAFVETLKCRTVTATEFAKKVISRLSGVNENYVVNYLIEFHEFWTPLNCINNEIFSHISVAFKHLILDLQEVSLTEITLPNDCDEVASRLETYMEVGEISSKRLGELIRHNREVFASLGLEDLFVESLIAFAPCLQKVIGIGLGSLLNADGSEVTQYLTGEINVLSYPFNCTEDGLNFIKNHYAQEFSDLYYGSIDSFDFNFTGRD